MTFDTLQTADYSPLLVHFTKDKPITMATKVGTSHPLAPHKSTSAFDKLESILRSRTIFAGPLPFLPHNPEAVCFTECVWKGLLTHADSYSPYGIVFSKRLIFDRGGGPALYMRGDTLKAIWTTVEPSLEVMIAAFDPDELIQPGVKIDTLQEREWRLPGELTFEYSDIKYVIVQSVEDAGQLVHRIGSHNVPESRVIPMDVYRTIESTWAGM